MGDRETDTVQLKTNSLTPSTLGKTSGRRHIEIYSLFFPENSILLLKQIVPICMKYQSLISGNKKKNISKWRLLIFYPEY